MEIEEYTAAVAAEYGKYVAACPIYIGGARAFSQGHPVPVGHVAAHPEWLEEGSVVEAGATPEPAPEAVPPPQGDDVVIDG